MDPAFLVFSHGTTLVFDFTEVTRRTTSLSRGALGYGMDFGVVIYDMIPYTSDTGHRGGKVNVAMTKANK